MAENHTLMGGKLHVYKREGSSYWQASAFLKGANRRISTKEESLAHAKEIAEDWYLEMRGKARSGDLKSGKKFREAAKHFLAEYVPLIATDRNPLYAAYCERRLKKDLMPFFGDKVLSEITPGLVQQYRAKRMQSQTRFGTPPARSTLHQEIVILRQILKNANRQGWIGVVPDLSPPYKTSGKITHRAWFSPDEYKTLYTATRKRAAAPLKRRWKWVSEQLHDYVLLLANTGLRPDEAARLEFRDVAVVKDHGSQETILEIEVRGKRGVGFCKSTAQAVLPFERLKKRLRPAPKGADGSASPDELPARKPKGAADEKDKLVLPGPTDRLFVGSQRELFNTILAEEGLKKDRDGKLRTAYSLRHTYISMRLMEGADIYQVAKNCRTSVEMIEKFYAAHIKTRLDASAINVRRGTIRREQEAKRAQNIEPPQARIMRSRRLAKGTSIEGAPSIPSLAGRPHPASLRRGPRGEMVDATDLSRED